MKLKVCGMRNDENIMELAKLLPDFMGLIFYEKSPRDVKENLLFEDFPQGIKRVGVFVNPEIDMVKEKVENYHLDMLQLHGEETIDFVKLLGTLGLPLIKAISVSDSLPMEKISAYETYVDYFLFDTKTPAYGGSGNKFDWSILLDYHSGVPFFLSGGIDLEDVQEIRKLNLKRLYAIDVNSRFEHSPGVKNIGKIQELIQRL